jgi:very-short-patch-repair endonuclease
MTDAEAMLWSKLRDRKLKGHKFRRQFPVAGFVADFVCREQRLLIEIDGGQHTPKRDERRSTILEGRGFRVLRYWNNEVLGNIDGVLLDISAALTTPSPRPSPPRGRGGIPAP